MISLQDMQKISEFEWEIPKSFRSDMRVPVRVFATRRLLEAVMNDRSLEQAVNSATLPGLVGHVIVMPDMHQGYGFPIGGVAATRFPAGVISPARPDAASTPVDRTGPARSRRVRRRRFPSEPMAAPHPPLRRCD